MSELQSDYVLTSDVAQVECSPREPRTRRYTDGTKTADFSVDDMGRVAISEEALDLILRKIGFIESVEPVLVEWEPRWMPPTIRAICPGCGRLADRKATSWSHNVNAALSVMMACDRSNDPQCWQVFNALLEVAA